MFSHNHHTVTTRMGSVQFTITEILSPTSAMVSIIYRGLDNEIQTKAYVKMTKQELYDYGFK